MLLGFPAPDLVDEVRMALVVVDQHGVVLARLPLRAVDVSTGTRGVLISLRDKSEAVTAETRFDATELTFNLKWSYSQPDLFSPLDLLPALKFAAALEGGGRMAIVFNGETLGPQDLGPFRSHSPGEAASYSHFLGDLANIQIKTGVFFDVSSDLTADEERDIEVASRLLNGETVKGTWNQMAIRITPDGREAVEAALVGPSPTHDFQTNSHMSLNLQGEVIPIGQVTNKFESAKVLS